MTARTRTASELTRAAGELFTALVPAFDRVFDDLDRLADETRRIAAEATEIGLYREDLDALRYLIFDSLERHRGLVAGTGVITAPDLLIDAPRWLEWWWTKASGTPEELRVNLDPGAPDFFDYATTDWYAGPERSGRRHVAGPYVDYACTNDYAVTLSVPIRDDEAMIGVAAADVLVSSLEGRVLPVLAGLARPVALANAAGRVIASNSARCAPGYRLPAGGRTNTALGTAATREHADASSIAAWVLVDVDQR
ncbi:MAG TPA: cache domain-containing protein [Micromonosporaceae bacterium]|nr:cache domain-containing protein [Micromonosporaceae bacterium]